MDRNRVADVLEEVALLLELKGENPFKSRAYRGAAATHILSTAPAGRLDEALARRR